MISNLSNIYISLKKSGKAIVHLLELIHKFKRVAGYKANIQNIIVFL